MERDIRQLRPTNGEELIEFLATFANLVPSIGGLLSGVALQATSSRRWDRLIYFIQSLEARLEDLEYLTDDQEELIIETVERVLREHSDEKRECYRNIILNGLGRSDFNYDDTLEMVKLVERLTPNHIRVLHIINDPEKAKSNLGSDKYVARTPASMPGMVSSDLGIFLLSPFLPDWPGIQLRRIWDELCDVYVIGRGAPRISLPSRDDEIGMDLVTATFRHYLTNYGYDFVNFILTSDMTLRGVPDARND